LDFAHKNGHLVAIKSSLQRKNNDNICDNVFEEKELVCTKSKLNELRKHQGFTRIECALMATTADLAFANVSASNIEVVNSNDAKILKLYSRTQRRTRRFFFHF